ncbi:MAG: BON domain-containing protein [Thermoguttaceae bacterium]|nr:BON domain-containing protein [Thermoguttaceae bacterium]
MADLMAGEILGQVRSALAESPIHELRTLQVEPVQNGLVLSGTVSSYYHKQLAQELVRSFCDRVGLALINRIQVEWGKQRGSNP